MDKDGQREGHPGGEAMASAVKGGFELRHWLKGWRQEHRMSQAALAEALGYDVTYIAKIEGGTRPPSRQFLARLAQVAGAPEEALVYAVSSDLVRPPLPVASDPVVGREKEMAEVMALLSGAPRIVTLVGPPGIGKSRLAMEVAARLDPLLLSGCWWVSLVDVTKASGVVHRVNRELGVANRPEEDPLERLVDRLRGHQALLVLDNFEHVMEARGVVAALGASTRGVVVLVTSREALDLVGEYVYRLAPLPLRVEGGEDEIDPAAGAAGTGTALELFAVRARMADPEFELTASNVGAVARTCNRLDGIPLSIILAAGAVKTEGVGGLERLAARPLDLPADAIAGLARHHLSLTAAIAGSWDLLEPDEAAFLVRLAVIAGSFDAGAAAAVAGEGGTGLTGVDRTTMRLLSSLTRKSLLEVRPDDRDVPRFHLLESIRSFAADRLEVAGAGAEARDRHLDYFARLAAECGAGLTREGQADCARRFAVEFDNIAAAFEFAIVGFPERAVELAASCWRFLLMRDIPTGRDWLARALEAAPSPSSARGHALAGAGALAWVTGHFHEARSLLDAAWQVGDELDLPDVQAMAWLNRGALADQLSMPDEADRCFVAALAIYERMGDDRGRAGALVGRGMVCRRRGDIATATTFWMEGARLFRAVGDRFNQTMALGNLAWAAEQEEQFEEAQEWLIDCRRIQLSLGDARGLATTTSGLARVATKRGALDVAEPLALEALVAYHQLGDRPWAAATLVFLAEVVAGRGGERHAVRLLGAADALWEDMGADPSAEDAERRAAVLGRCAARLTAGEVERSMGAGRSMTTGDAIEFARRGLAGGRDGSLPPARSATTWDGR